MNRYARVGVPVALALGLHALVFLWPVDKGPPAAPRTLAVSVVTPAPAAPRAPVVPRSNPVPSVPAPAAAGPPEATAPAPVTPSVDPAPASPTAVPPAALPQALTTEPGSSSGSGALADSGQMANDAEVWSGVVRGRVDAKKTYPYAARAQGLQGRVTVAFVVGPEGRVTDGPRVIASSGYASLDRAALAAVQAASPFPVAPSSLGPGPWPFTVTLAFTLR